MSARSPVELANKNGVRVGNEVVTSSNSLPPSDVVYEFLMRLSGPVAASADRFDMNTNSGATDSIFNYRVPRGKTFKFSRINFVLVDNQITPGNFGGINGGLADGCLLQIVDSDGIVILNHFGTDLVPIKTNADFAPLAGTDLPIAALAGDDLLPIRFSIFKTGTPILLTAKQSIRWTNRDNLSTLTKFRAMIQGVFI